MFSFRKIASAVGIAALTLTAGAYPGIAQDKPKLGVLIYNVGQDPWLSVAVKSFEEKGAEMGFDVTVVDGRNDISQMNAAIDQFRIQQVDAIIVQPADPDSLVGTVKQATDAGIPGHRLQPQDRRRPPERRRMSAPTKSRWARLRPSWSSRR